MNATRKLIDEEVEKVLQDSLLKSESSLERSLEESERSLEESEKILEKSLIELQTNKKSIPLKKDYNLPSNFVTRWEWIYEYSECPLDVVVYCNDFDVWKDGWVNDKDNSLAAWLWVYDKLRLSKSYNITCAPLGIYPDDKDYPVIVKPTVNLYSSGKGVLKFNSNQELIKFSRSELGCGMMWTSCFSGEHYSIDVVIIKGKIKYHVAFKGHPSDLCEYDWWEYEKSYELSSNLKEWIKKNFKGKLFGSGSDTPNFTGIINIETIDDRLIDCKLRMNWLSTIGIYESLCTKSNLIGKSIIELYSKGKCSLDIKDFSTTLPNLYVVPISINYDDYEYITNPEWDTIKNLSSKKYKGVWMIQRCPSPDVNPHPVNNIKTWTIFTTDLEEGLALKDDIKEMIQPKRMVYYISKTKEKLHGISPLIFQSPFNIAIGAAIIICIFVLIQWIRHTFSGIGN